MENKNLDEQIEYYENLLNQQQKQHDTLLNNQQKLQEQKSTMEKENSSMLKIEKNLKNIEEMFKITQNSVKTITKEQLYEIQTYKQPPTRIKFCLEAVFYLLYEKIYDWKKIVQEMNSGQFLESMSKIDIRKIKPKIINNLHKNYVNTEQWDLEKFQRASQTITPLAVFISTIDTYTREIEKIKPIKQKMIKLKKAYEQLENEIKENNDKIKETDKIINTNQDIYNDLLKQQYEKEETRRKTLQQNDLYFHEGNLNLMNAKKKDSYNRQIQKPFLILKRNNKKFKLVFDQFNGYFYAKRGKVCDCEDVFGNQTKQLKDEIFQRRKTQLEIEEKNEFLKLEMTSLRRVIDENINKEKIRQNFNYSILNNFYLKNNFIQIEKFEKLKQENEKLLQQIQEQNLQEQNLNQQNQTLQNKNQDLSNELDKLMEKNFENKEILNKKDEQIDELNKLKIIINDKDQQLNELQEKYQNLQNQIQEKEINEKTQEQKLQNLQQQLNDQEIQIKKQQEENEQIEQKNQNIEKLLNEKIEIIKNQNEKIKKLEEEIIEKENIIKQLKEQIEKQKQENNLRLKSLYDKQEFEKEQEQKILNLQKEINDYKNQIKNLKEENQQIQKIFKKKEQDILKKIYTKQIKEKQKNQNNKYKNNP